MISDSDQSKINAETATQNRKKGEKLDVEEVILRAMKQDGVGLTPAEVWALIIKIDLLDDQLQQMHDERVKLS